MGHGPHHVRGGDVAQIAGFAVALRAKGETVEEISGLVGPCTRTRTHRCAGPIVDIVGTGGDRANTVNISTMSAIVVAGTGAKVVKHGNRAASSAAAPPTFWRRSASIST